MTILAPFCDHVDPIGPSKMNVKKLKISGPPKGHAVPTSRVFVSPLKEIKVAKVDDTIDLPSMWTQNGAILECIM